MAGTGLPRSPSAPTLSRLLRLVSVAELRRALLSFAVALAAQRGADLGVVATAGKTMGGVWEDGQQLRVLHKTQLPWRIEPTQ